ncbi:MAG: hypothetical protein AVDCRST_MAG89-4605, partial [uncultured Gemmatimonadetes bacterium]
CLRSKPRTMRCGPKRWPATTGCPPRWFPRRRPRGHGATWRWKRSPPTRSAWRRCWTARGCRSGGGPG